MKKVKFPIILKIAILGILASGIGSGVALTISSINQQNRSKETLITNIDQSLYSVEFNYTKELTGATSTEELADVISYVRNDVYNREDIHDKTLDGDFNNNFDEYEQYFQKRAPWIFPDPNSMIGSQAYFDFARKYRELTHIITEAFLSSGGRAAYVCFKDELENETRLVFVADSRITNPNENDKFYHLPGSHYSIKEFDKVIDVVDENYYGFELAGYLTRFVPIYQTDGEGNQVEVADFFIEYDLNEVTKKDREILGNEIIIISSVMVASIVLYMLLSHFTITRNLNKLTTQTDNISSDLKEHKGITPVPLNIKSRDEIASLASSFEIMEQEIVNYVNIIKQEAKENERREAELSIASDIQLSALPSRNFMDNNVKLSAYIKPAKVVGGDFYDYFYFGDNLVLLIADVSGKGVPAAMFMMKAKTLLKAKILSGLSLVDSIATVNNELTINNDSSLFVTAFVAIIDSKNNEIRFVNAGHEKPYIIHQNEIIKLDGTSNFVLGGEEDLTFIEEKSPFVQGDTLFTFTDGLNESINKDNEEFGYDRIVETLKECKDSSLNEKITYFNNKLKDFVKEEEQFDDITMVVLERKDNSLSLHFEKKDYSIIDETMEEFYKVYGSVDEEVKAHVGIALDELLNNQISYEKREDLVIDIDFSFEKDDLKVVITSNGADYNPFVKHVHKHLSKDDDDTTPGGFGVTLVKTLSKSYSYEYKNKKSVISLIFK